MIIYFKRSNLQIKELLKKIRNKESRKTKLKLIIRWIENSNFQIRLILLLHKLINLRTLQLKTFQ